ncbi:EI24 domain-containing protein [Roseateles amylovorans]|uniref:EI24 domain-containing protein n=1 Tax=Roseateles amylovorans TaxID=2978473 RepID=A0ABY6AWR6_9BURK|nr:EI24 domain-containing protein [Roseateles amylovorans]UXH77245.1 EI24 domain-containing protein [Roseateles amylovorans]
MIKPMSRIADGFWRAAAYCLHPRVIGWSLLPLILLAALSAVLSYFFWESAVAGVRATLESWSLIEGLLKWLDSLGAGGFRTVLAPMVVIVLASPALVMLCLLAVAAMMTPALADLVAQRRFPGLERKHGAGFFASLGWSLGHTLVAMVVLVLSLPFWLIPPIALIVPPLTLGWLCYRVFTFDVLSEFASAPERRALLSEHRLPLMLVGLVTGYLGAAPAALWAFSALTLALAPLFVLLFVFLSTLVFAFSSLWFSHYALAALQDMRRTNTVTPREPDPVMDVLPANYATAPPLPSDGPDFGAPALDKPSPLNP